jgi:hypothetical protein
MICKICETNSKFRGTALILGKYRISYYQCDFCGFIQTENPYWLEESYASAINFTDTGIISRNLMLSGVVKIILSAYFDRKGKYCDYAGGYGIFTRLMRDHGFDFYWTDPYCANLTARGFEYTKEVGELALLTAFEVMEHLNSPLDDIADMLNLSDSILFSTNLYKRNQMPSLDKWWYYGLEHGQHIAIYCKETFEFIAKKFQLNFYTDNKSIHLLTRKQLNPKIFPIIVKAGKRSYVSNLFNAPSKTESDMYLLKHKISVDASPV